MQQFAPIEPHAPNLADLAGVGVAPRQHLYVCAVRQQCRVGFCDRCDTSGTSGHVSRALGAAERTAPGTGRLDTAATHPAQYRWLRCVLGGLLKRLQAGALLLQRRVAGPVGHGLRVHDGVVVACG
jgi:hypothetical protein